MTQPHDHSSPGGTDQPGKPDATPAKTRRTRRVLLVDRTPALTPVLEQAPAEVGPVRVLYAATLARARELVEEQGPIDVAVIEPDLADGSGLDFAEQLAQSKAITQSVVVSSSTDLRQAQRAMRAGATDYILRPAASDRADDVAASASSIAEDLADRLRAALERQQADRQQARRLRRLKKLCRRLNDARQEVSDQVDVLCNDLVTAYQELAQQMHHLSTAADLTTVIDDELDLEVLLRKTLEHLIKLAGPCNAAIFLPATVDEFSLGGYVNYNCTKDSADMLLQHLADVLAPRIADHSDELVMHVTSNHTMTELLGDDWNYLADCHLLTFACTHEGDALAVVALFRDDSEPFSDTLIDAAATVGEMLGDQLAKIIRIHHRGMDDVPFDTQGADDTYLPPSEWDSYDRDADPFDDDPEWA
ncbi:MAG: response regulator [Planctomycetota bacterium]